MKKLCIIMALVAMVFAAGCKKNETYTVVFNANGGTGTMAEQVFTEGQQQALSANTYTRDGYDFKNWSTTPDGTGTSYFDQQFVTMTANTTLYAQWEEIVILAPTISLTADKTFITSGETVSFTIQADANINSQKDIRNVKLDVVYNGENVYANTENVNAATYSKVYDLQMSGNEGDEFVVTATVTDVDNMTASETVTVTIVAPVVVTLVESPFTWTRQGSADGVGLDEFGLQWISNAAKSLYAVIEPVYGAKMCRLLPEEYANVTNAAQLQALVDNSASIQYWKEFDLNGSSPQTFNVVLGTFYNNQYHLIHITNAEYSMGSSGLQATITGMAK